MNTTDLGGHSGCTILLCEEEDNSIFVRKISGDLSYNKRLEVQANKQASFKSKMIKTPSILKQGYNEQGLFFYDMEYVQGITLAQYMQTIEIGKVRGLVETLVNDIISVESNDLEVEEKVFENKIDLLREQLSNENNPIIDEAIIMLSSHFWKQFTHSTCHGDLTLENIIVKDNQLYLIDFLDSFYDSWIMDMGTLLQDVQTLWSYRCQKEININTLIRIIVFRDILIDEISKISISTVLESYYALLLKLIRIYPYTKDRKTYEFLNKKTKSIIEIIKRRNKV